jgi:hypothetical protein
MTIKLVESINPSGRNQDAKSVPGSYPENGSMFVCTPKKTDKNIVVIGATERTPVTAKNTYKVYLRRVMSMLTSG